MFKEVFLEQPTENYGHFVLDTKTKKLQTLDIKAQENDLIDPVAFAYDFGERMYDARLGKWLSTDPLERKFPEWSPYSAFANNPIRYIDINGEWLGDVNILINVDDLTNEYNLKSNDWTIIRKKTFADASKEVSNQFNKINKIDNLVFLGHGSHDYDSKSAIWAGQDNNTSIKLADLVDFNAGKKPNLAQVGAFKEIRSIESTAKFLDDNATVTFLQCGAGNQDDFSKELFKLIDNATTAKNISIITNTDNTSFETIDVKDGKLTSIGNFDRNLVKNLSEGYSQFFKDKKGIIQKKNLGNLKVDSKNPSNKNIIETTKQPNNFNKADALKVTKKK